MEHPWEQQEDDELEEVLVAIRKNLNQTPLSTTINGDFSSNNGGSFAVSIDEHQEEEEEEEVVKHFSQQNGIKVNEDEKDKHQRSEYCVYYDTDKGIWKCRICSWDSQGRTCLIGHNQDPRLHLHRLVNVKTVYENEGTVLQSESSTVEGNVVDSTSTATASAPAPAPAPAHGNADITGHNQDNGNGVYTVISNQNGGHQKHDNFSNISFEELDKSSPSYINNKTRITEIEVIKDGVDEISEFDVETVIKKQDTHDLFCPNCNSCITKRVILRKRKRRIPFPGEDAKRNKPEIPIPSEANVISDYSSNNHAQNGGDISLDDVQPSESNEYDHQREPDVFRCLSCFSIFMPTGNGFKLFRMLGNKRSEEINQPSQKEVPVKRSWFSNIFASDKVEQLNNQGVVESSEVGMRQEVDSHITNGTTVLEEKPAAEFVPSSSFHEKDLVQSATPSVSRDGNAPSSIHGSDIIKQRVAAVLEEKPAAEFVPSSSTHDSKGGVLEEKSATEFVPSSSFHEKDLVQSATPYVSRDGNAPSSTHGSDIIEQRVAAVLEEKPAAEFVPSSSTHDSKGGVLEEKPAAEFVPSSSFHDSKGRVLEKDLVQSATPSVSRDGNAPSSTQGSDIIEQWVAEESDNTLKESNESKDKSNYPGMFVVKPPNNNVEPSDRSIFPLQYDGLKLIVPPNVGSLIIDNSQIHQELDVTVLQTNNPVPEVSIQNDAEVHLEEPLKLNKDVLTERQIKLFEDLKNSERIKGKDTIISIGATGSSALQHVESESEVVEHGGRSLDIVKSVVYGGLIELIASLSVVSSSVGAGAATLNVLALGLANIFGGLIVISHDLWDLKNEPTRGSSHRYQQLLGQRADFPLHMVASLLSYLVFGFLPPIVYGFSFRESNDRDLKLLMVAAAAIVCIMTLSAGKAYVQRPPKSYFKTIVYYVMLGLMVSGISYLFGGLIMKLLEKLDIFHLGSVGNLSIQEAGPHVILM